MAPNDDMSKLIDQTPQPCQVAREGSHRSMEEIALFTRGYSEAMRTTSGLYSEVSEGLPGQELHQDVARRSV